MTASTIFLLWIAAFISLLALDRVLPLRQRRRALLPRLVVNIMLAALAYVCAASLVKPAAMAASGWALRQPFGLLALFPLSLNGQIVVSFLLMDLSFYDWHLLNHRWPLLWRFHNVHHIDPDLDISTAVRFHFMEIVFSTLFRIVQVAIIGISPALYIVYEIAFQASTLFQHSNVRLPIRFERLLNKVFVTPRMHGIHHSGIENETHSDFSAVLSIWDRLHGTLRLNVPQSRITIGIPAYDHPRDNTFWSCLSLPFRRQRDYFRFADDTPATRDPGDLGPRRTHLAE